MADFFYSLSMWQATILVLGAALAVGLAASTGVRMIFRLKPTDQEADVAINLMQVAAAYIGIMLAFAAVSVWQNYANAQTAVHQEAATTSELYRDLTIYGPESMPTRQALRGYIASVVTDEWPLLREGKRSTVTAGALDHLYTEFGKIEVQSNRESAIYSEAFSKLNDLVAFRRDRITDSRTGIPPILWIVGLAGSILTVAYAAAFTSSRFSVMMTCGISMTIGLLFLFLLVVDNPFNGPAKIGTDELTEVMSVLDRIDKSSLDQPAARPPS